MTSATSEYAPLAASVWSTCEEDCDARDAHHHYRSTGCTLCRRSAGAVRPLQTPSHQNHVPNALAARCHRLLLLFSLPWGCYEIAAASNKLSGKPSEPSTRDRVADNGEPAQNARLRHQCSSLKQPTGPILSTTTIFVKYLDISQHAPD